MHIYVGLFVCSPLSPVEGCRRTMVNSKTNPSFVLHGIRDVRFEEVSNPLHPISRELKISETSLRSQEMRS
jgi:hypothetical protein